jgi:hypothetical protein
MRLEELLERPEPLVIGAVHPSLAVAAHGDETGVSQEGEVLRHAGVAQLDLLGDLPDGQLVAPDGSEDVLAARLGEELQRVHRLTC